MDNISTVPQIKTITIVTFIEYRIRNIILGLLTLSMVLPLISCGPTDQELEMLVSRQVQTVIANMPTPVVHPTTTPAATATPQPTPTVVPFLPTPTPFQLRPTPVPPPTATAIAPLPTVTPQPVADFQKIYASIWPSVFMVKAGTGHGTGWLIEPDIILTNEHVIRGHSSVSIYQNSEQPFMADVISSDSQRDIAILRFDPNSAPLAPNSNPLTLGDVSSENIAQPMMALGYSGEYPIHNDATVDRPSANVGVLSLIIDFGPQSGGYTLVMDVPVDPGDSGGPVVNGDGEVIGMTRGVVETSSSGQRVVGTFYALHIDEIKKSLPALKSGLSR